MCFYSEADWYSSVNEQTEPTAEKVVVCEECRVRINPGEKYYHLFMQESETCLLCDDAECECPKDDDGDCIECKCEEPAYGESYTYRSCLECQQFLKGVAAHERAEGCRPGESRPSLGGMIEEISEFDRPQIQEYFAAAEKLHPELRASGYLDRLWVKIVGEDEDEPIVAGTKTA